MNTANLQLEGLCLAVASVNRLLVAKGILSQSEIDTALRKAESAIVGDERITEQLSPANRDAVCFPIRLLQLANSAGADTTWSFSHLAKLVGETKRPYNDQI
ncbi:hypothetical protein C5748_25665 [Phyllobacterium phragmitis]|uniref:Uncharacterized protein n=1 Tax=Phyllobacterium phragmitis TaxID=2670329 RepID=A0A2S9IJF1_9HYPH|nr:hypothetical protein [Phyllobacterium phragmitis]PRD40656.1 hypothetical protein C5748_25665 [Phyllobacterium phragmitis]